MPSLSFILLLTLCLATLHLRSYKQTPLDDLESLCYSLLEMATGDLPWGDIEDRVPKRGPSQVCALGEMLVKLQAEEHAPSCHEASAHSPVSSSSAARLWSVT